MNGGYGYILVEKRNKRVHIHALVYIYTNKSVTHAVKAMEQEPQVMSIADESSKKKTKEKSILFVI